MICKDAVLTYTAAEVQALLDKVKLGVVLTNIEKQKLDMILAGNGTLSMDDKAKLDKIIEKLDAVLSKLTIGYKPVEPDKPNNGGDQPNNGGEQPNNGQPNNGQQPDNSQPNNGGEQPNNGQPNNGEHACDCTEAMTESEILEICTTE